MGGSSKYAKSSSIIGSMVLGLNDAVVEMTGTLAGLSFAFRDTQMIALSGLVTGIAASLSMAASQYLSAKSEGQENPLKSGAYTGVMYFGVVILLVLPYLLFPKTDYFWASVVMIVTTLLVLVAFNWYLAVTQGSDFKTEFIRMATISLSVAAISFFLGLLARKVLGVEG